MPRLRLHPAAAALASFALLVLVLAGCGGGGGDGTDPPAPAATECPSAKGKTIGQLLRDSGAKPTKLVISPAALVFDRGANRYPFGGLPLRQKEVEEPAGAPRTPRDRARLPGPDERRQRRRQLGLRRPQDRLRQQRPVARSGDAER